MPDGAGGTPLAPVSALAAELGDLKRVRDAASPDSVASRLFRRAWAALVGGEDPEAVALAVTADALAAARLGGMDAALLRRIGLDAAEAGDVLRRSFDEVLGDEVADPIPSPLRGRLRTALGRSVPENAHLPAFVAALVRQPRAGATCPGKPRLVLEPPENHGDHCLGVAVLGVVLSARFGADPAPVFLAGLAHHLHNAVLPDSGFAGEMLLGDHLAPAMRRLFDEGLAALPPALRAATAEALALIPDASTPVGQAFHAADVIDRVLQMRHFARVAAFTVDQALEDLELVHAGPVQNFHHQVLREAALP